MRRSSSLTVGRLFSGTTGRLTGGGTRSGTPRSRTRTRPRRQPITAIHGAPPKNSAPATSTAGSPASTLECERKPLKCSRSAVSSPPSEASTSPHSSASRPRSVSSPVIAPTTISTMPTRTHSSTSGNGCHGAFGRSSLSGAGRGATAGVGAASVDCAARRARLRRPMTAQDVRWLTGSPTRSSRATSRPASRRCRAAGRRASSCSRARRCRRC